MTYKPYDASAITQSDQKYGAPVSGGNPGANITRVANVSTNPTMSAKHATAMPFSRQNFPFLFVSLLRVFARNPPSPACPLSVASCGGVLPSASVALSTATPPACASVCAASALPRIAAQCSGVHPSESCFMTSASQKSRSFTASGKPLGSRVHTKRDMSGWSSKASVGVQRRRGVSGLKARDPGRRERTAKVLKDRRSPRRRGRMGTSVKENAPLYAAQCSGVRPSPSAASTSASHRVLKW